MEDFGYKRDDEPGLFSDKVKKAFLIGATLFSVTCFIYITLNAYYFVYQDQDADVEIIESPKNPIKVFVKDEEKDESMQIDRSIYEDIFGNNKNKKKNLPKVRKVAEPAKPPQRRKLERLEKVEIKDEKPTRTRTLSKEEQQIVVYSDSNKKRSSARDLLTNTNGERRVINLAKQNTKQENRRKAIRVQIAAFTSQISAQDSWQKLSRLYPTLFYGLKYYIEEVDLKQRGIFYRLQIGNFFNQVEAEKFCEKYVSQTKKSRADCIVVE